MGAIEVEYKVIDNLNFCGNNLLQVNNIIDDKGFIPLIIKMDNYANPVIWMKAKTKQGIIDLVQENRGVISGVDINQYENDSRITISIKSKKENYLLLEMMTMSEIPTISKLDLRPIGYNIFGDINSLSVGGTSLKGNTFKGETFIKS